MFQTDLEFEDEVRRISRLLWPVAEYGGAAMEDGRERDGVFISDEYVYLIECTVSRSKQKATEDGNKLAKLCRKMQARYPDKFVKGWFVTLHEPTAEQRTAIQKHREKIVAVSFDQFRSKLVDARSYLNARESYPFGSVRDPETGSAQTQLDYVPLGILDRSGKTHSVNDIGEALNEGHRFVLLGDYGAGKSSTMRELFFSAARKFWTSNTLKFPVLLNLRDHHGQSDPTEALERHARRVGFSDPSHLVRAWRAGYILLFLDGFDEIATAGWAGRTKKLKDLRYRSMELVRNFIRESADGTGIVIAGREHFFDSERELTDALGVSDRFTRLTLSEFTVEQVTEYLKKCGWEGAVPEWLPSRPLLLGYLASRGLLDQTIRVERGSSPAAGWNGLLERISERESEIEAGIDAGTVRSLIERLATLARNSIDGLGPLTPDQIVGAFTSVCGYPPDDRGAVLLQRLPGLGGSSAEDGSRVFIDRDLAASASAGEVFRYVENPYTSDIDSSDWQSALPPLGLEVAALRCSAAKFPLTKVSAALEHCSGRDQDTLAADLALTLQYLNASYEGASVYIRDALVPEILLSEGSGNITRVEFQDCIVSHLEMDYQVNAEQIPMFRRCYFTSVEGRTGERDLPSSKFIECVFDEFEDEAQTTNALLDLSLPLGTKVLLTVLKKLYAQRGKGRRESALFRGLDHRAQRHIPTIISLLKREGFISKAHLGNQTVWLPTKGADTKKRALRILAAPNTVSDPLLESSAMLD
jgi:AraC-like DNA-binding protein